MDLCRYDGTVQCATDMHVPQIHAHQIHIVGGLKHTLIAADALIADERVNQDRAVLQGLGHGAEPQKGGTSLLTMASQKTYNTLEVEGW